MTDGFTLTAEGDAKLVARFDKMPDRLHAALLTKMRGIATEMVRHITEDKLSGQVLGVVSGDLKRSIFSEITDSSDKIIAVIASRNDVKYGAIHEYGGKTSPHRIVPDKARMLAFEWHGAMTFRFAVNHPGSRMPERSFMRSALADQRDQILGDLRDAVTEGSAP